MVVNLNTNALNRPRFLGELSALSQAEITLSEFKYKRDTEIFGEAEPAVYVYQIIDGAARSYKLLSDGRRQIGAFHLVGDIFGLENLCRLIRRTVVFTSASAVNRYVPPGRK